MRTIDIPGGTAQLRERPDMKARQRRMVEAAAMQAEDAMFKVSQADRDEVTGAVIGLHLDRDESEALIFFQDTTIVALLHSWTLKQPVPKTVDDLLDNTDVEVHEALVKATVDLGADLIQMVRGVDFDPTPDADSPTVPSSASNGTLRDDEESHSMPTWSPPTGSTSTGSSTESVTSSI